MPSVVRSAVPADLEALVEISGRCFDNPWSRESLADDIERSWTRVLVAETERGDIAAFVHYWLVAGEVQVMNVATDPTRRRCGHARALVEAMLIHARALGCEAVLLEVRATNAAAIGLYAGLGFAQTGMRARYYDDGEDAVLMTASL